MTTHPVRVARRGAAAIELALVLPFLVVVFAMAVDFGRVFHTTQVLQSAADAGAGCASGNTWVPTGDPDDATRAAAVAAAATLNLPLRTDQVTVSTSGSLVTVAVDYDFPLLTAVLVPDGTVRLRRTVTARVAPRAGN